MWNFREDLAKGKEMEKIAMEVIRKEMGLNLIENPNEKWIDIILIENVNE